MPFQIIRNDITKVKADAIVNTANPQPVIGAGSDAAVYRAAGENELLAERKKIGKIARGDIAVTAFQNHLMKLLVEKDLSSTVVYKSSNITKGNFSKMLTGDTKHPQKKAVLGLCIGMKLNLKEAEELLASADMAFNPYNKRDKLVIPCILQG